MPRPPHPEPRDAPTAPTLRWAWALNLLALLPVLPMLAGMRIPIQHDIFISDLLHSQLPYKTFLGRSLAEGHLPLWMPDVFSGIPLLASIEAGPLFPPHALLYGLLDPYTALGLSLCLEIFAAALGAWFLARRLGAGPVPALLAGLAFSWSGFMVTHVRHLNMHASAAVLPWLLLALERLLASRGRRGGVTLALLMTLLVLAGHPQIVFIACLLLGARLLAHWLRRDWPAAWRDRLREGVSFALACGLGLAAAAVQLMPTWAYTQQSLGQVEPTWAYAAAFPCPPRDLLALIWPPLVGSMETWDYASQQASTIAWGNYGYGGVVALVMIIPALALGLRRRAVWFWAVALIVSLLLVIGPHTPLYHLAWAWIPGMKLFRFPTRFLLVSAMALAVLGALGFEAVLTWLRPRVGRRSLLGLGLMVVLLALLDLQHHQLPRLPMDDTQSWREAGLATGLPAQPDPNQRVLVLDEFVYWETPFRQAKGHTAGPEPYRRAWTLPLGSAGLMNHLRSASGYARMVHWRTAAQWQEYNRDILPQKARPGRPTAANPKVSATFQAQLDRASVAWLVSPHPLLGEALELADHDLLWVYHNRSPLPRAYLTHAWQPVEDYAGATAWLAGQGAQQPGVPVVEGAAAPSPSGDAAPTPLQVQEHGPNAVSIAIPADSTAGMLVLGDAWDAGWQAWVDGTPATVLVANGYQRAVPLPAGATLVTMGYAPPGLVPGLVISLLALMALLGWTLLDYRRRGSSPADSEGSRGARTT